MPTDPPRDGDPPPPAGAEAIAERACAEAGGVLSPDALAGYVRALLAAVEHGRRLDSAERERSRDAGARAAEQGVALASVVDAYLSATRLAWAGAARLLSAPEGVPPSTAAVVGGGETVLRAADDALAAVAAGYADARGTLLRQEEAARREFVDDLLGGQVDVADLVPRAGRFGVRMAEPHVVAVAATSTPLQAGRLPRTDVANLLRARLGERDILVGTKQGRLVCVVSTGPGDAAGPVDGELFGGLVRGSARDSTDPADDPLVAVGRPHAGALGVATSYREAADALDIARRLRWETRVVHAGRLGVYRVLLRDTDAITELVQEVLGPLAGARGGAEPLLQTLVAYVAHGAVATATARALHLSVRAVTYRLDRIHTLTGYDPTDPADWLTLHVAATGARLLDWPDR